MKKLFTILLIINTIINGHAQFKFSGHIAGTTKADTFYINIPYIYGYYHENDVAIPVNAKGYFNINLSINQQKFGNIRFQGKAIYLLLTPGKSLLMDYNPADSSSVFNGSAAIENRLLYQVDLNGTPFFAKEYKNNTYAKLGPADLQEKVVKPWAAIRDKNIAMVQASGVPETTKKLFIQEIKANYVLQLNSFARVIMDRADSKPINNLVLQIYDHVPLAADILPAGPLYYTFADSYIGYQETLIFTNLSAAKFKDPATLLPRYNITIDSGNAVAKLKGKSFVNWILVHNTYPKNIAGPWLAQNIFAKCSTRDLAGAQPLMDELRALYPQSKYIPYLSDRIDTLAAMLVRNRNNKEIRVAAGYENMRSIYEAISELKGKVVYVDVWGTWCGPCKEELRYNPQLKQHFKGKEVAFVYLDMDNDTKDAQWKEFITVNGITGLHLRKNNKDIQQFWAELLPKGDTEQYYPMYFIFDKDGKLVQHHAKRPSDKEELYKQIERYL